METAVGHFVMGSHNSMVTALGSCVEWPLLVLIMCLVFKNMRSSSSACKDLVSLPGFHSHSCVEMDKRWWVHAYIECSREQGWTNLEKGCIFLPVAHR